MIRPPTSTTNANSGSHSGGQHNRFLCCRADKLEIHHTPKHGSWLNLAEIELSAWERQCLGQRLADRDAVVRATSAWAARRNATGRPIMAVHDRRRPHQAPPALSGV